MCFLSVFSLCVFSVCVLSVCFLCVFFLSVFSVCVFSLCFLSVFSTLCVYLYLCFLSVLSVCVFCLCFLSGFAFYRTTKNDTFLRINFDIILLWSGLAGQLLFADINTIKGWWSANSQIICLQYRYKILTRYFGLSGYPASSFLIAEFSINTLSTNIFPISLPSTTRSCSIQMQVGMVTGVAKPDLEQTLKNPRARMKINKGSPFSSCVRVSQEHAKNASAATTFSRQTHPVKLSGTQTRQATLRQLHKAQLFRLGGVRSCIPHWNLWPQCNIFKDDIQTFNSSTVAVVRINKEWMRN